jgi:HK97 family phage major capsid protein/HK97 family phage prohead protease
LEKRILTLSAELRATSGRNPTIKGHIPFNSLSKKIEGHFNEKILPGAFRDTIKNDAIHAFWSHDPNKPIASTENGTLLLSETGTGLDVTLFPEVKTSWGRDAYEAVRSGLVRGFSFGFMAEKDHWSDDGSIRELAKVRLYEVSPVMSPAYQESQIIARGGGRNVKNMKFSELIEERGRVYDQMQKYMDKGYENLNSEQRSEYDRLETRYDELTSHVDAKRKEENFSSITDHMNSRDHEPIRPGIGDQNWRGVRTSSNYWYSSNEQRIQNRLDEVNLAAIFNGIESRGPVYYRLQRSGEKELRLWNRFLTGGTNVLSVEQRSVFMDDDLQGGFLVAPQKFVTDLVQDVRDNCYALRVCRTIPAQNADSLGVASLDAEPDDGDWTSELRTGSEDDAMKFGKRELHPHPLAKRIKVSKKLLRAAPRVDAIVRDALKYKLSVPIEKAWISTVGDGVNKPLSVFIDSEHGITSARDVSTSNTQTSIKSDNLIECKYGLKPQYMRNAQWVFHRDVLKKIRLLKDGDGQYLWRAGISADRPDTILDIPFLVSEFAPSTFSAGQYVGILGDFSNYWFAIALNMQVQVLTELYAETNQNGYIARAEIDGQPMVEEAFVRVTLAS